MTTQTKVNIFTYTLVVALVILGFFFTFRAHAEIPFKTAFNPEYLINQGDEDYVNPALSMDKKCSHHAYWMKTYYWKAKDITWYLPNYDDQEKAKLCYSTAVALAVPPNNIAKVIVVAAGLFTKYGLDCIESFHEVSHLVHRAAYHAEMYEFYCDLIPEDNDEEPEEKW
jgi:hypothetical protein